MAVKFYLDKRPANKKGEVAVRVSIYIKAVRAISTIGYTVSPEAWIQDEQKVDSAYKISKGVTAKVITPLQDYLKNLKEGEVFCHNTVYESCVFKADISEDGETLAVVTTSEHVKGGSGFVLCLITYKDGHYIHENGHSFFEEIGAEKSFTLALGREWTGGDVFDYYC